MENENSTKRIEATERSLEILETLSDLGSASATKIAEEVGLPKSTTHYHLKTLKNAEFVQENGGYQVGMKLLTMGHRRVDQMDLYKIGKPKVDHLAQETDELCILMMEEYGYGYYIYDNRGGDAVNFDTTGNQKYLHNNALGKAVLSHLPKTRVNNILDRHGLPATTDQTITDRKKLDEDLATARNDGVAFDYEEQLEGLCCVAAPIQDVRPAGEDVVQGAISIAVPASRAQESYFTDELTAAVFDTANLIELEMKEY